MAKPTKRGNSYHMAVKVRGIRKTATFRTKREAEEWGIETARSLRLGKANGAGGATFGDAMARFAKEECPTRKCGDWETHRLAYLSKDPIAKVPLFELTPEAVHDWQKRRLKSVKGSTVRRDRSLLTAVMAKVVRIWRWIPESAFRSVPLPPDEAPRVQMFGEEDIERLRYVAGTNYTEIGARTIAMLEFCIETGMRGGEAISLTDTTAPKGRQWVHLGKTKNGTARDVALSERASTILEEIRKVGLNPIFGLDESQKDSNFRKLAKIAGVRDLHFHDSRRTACTRLAKQMPMLDLARQLGIKKLDILMVYYQPSVIDRVAMIRNHRSS